MSAIDREYGGTHYQDMEIEPIEAMRAWLSPREYRGFLRAAAIKHLARAGRKGGFRMDVEKARHYLDFLLEDLDAEEIAANEAGCREDAAPIPVAPALGLGDSMHERPLNFREYPKPEAIVTPGPLGWAPLEKLA